MALKKTLFTLFFILLTFQACSTKNHYRSESFNYNKSFPLKSNYDYQITENLSYSDLYKVLYNQYNEWKGVKYKYGGNSKNGIDCSAFVQRTFRDKLHIKIPRTTKYQSSFGKNISMEELELGDLIFFKTGFNTRHVGIYLESGKFLHASTKHGVTISHMDNGYYQDKFWKIQRVIY